MLCSSNVLAGNIKNEEQAKLAMTVVDTVAGGDVACKEIGVLSG